jgi:hypothetical protein
MPGRDEAYAGAAVTRQAHATAMAVAAVFMLFSFGLQQALKAGFYLFGFASAKSRVLSLCYYCRYEQK